ncbi:uncharacterized protein LOC113229806 [Hyposmocoma kahamanoa]|uniref:uncharacterized protein LOC113229806 n=1 Tax=Hyposmocoma kahamanoa TaxID=1477025 RepID=UPI000E6D66CD|nr:uncharacterized protein LOC113229806 [Hyposmocoma kahamanoa]
MASALKKARVLAFVETALQLAVFYHEIKGLVATSSDSNFLPAHAFPSPYDMGSFKRGVKRHLLLQVINIDMHTRVIKILDGDIDSWYSLSEFDVIESDLGVTGKVLKNFARQYTNIISLRNVNAVLLVALDENCIKRNPFASLRSDTSLTDFELRCEQGSVPVHRVVLAISSPVLKTFLEGENNWLENSWYRFAKTDLSTLQHLKDYIYMGVLPDDGLENLLLLASCYMMDDLKNECISKILANVTPENALEICEFSIVNKMTKLFLGFLKIVQDGTVKVEEIANV